MTYTEWLAAKKGRAVELAKHLGVTESAVWHWKKDGVPAARMKAVRDFTQGEVSLEELVPGPVRLHPWPRHRA